jgi:predicted permease
MPTPNWREVVWTHAATTGATRLPLHAIDELAVHLEDLYRTARADGLSHDEAYARALEALAASRLADLVGPVSRLRDPVSLADVAGLARPSFFRGLSMAQALRLAVRQFTQQRAFALVTVLVLGLGTGASVTVYSIVDGVLLTPLPYREPDRLITWWDTNHERGLTHEPLSPVTFLDYRNLDVFEDAAAWWRPDVNLTDPGLDPVRVTTIETGANLFQVLGVGPQVGPGFPDAGPMFSTDLIAVISDRLWRARYDADPDLVGRTLQLNGAPYTIVGIMPPGFHFPDDVDVWQRSRWDFQQHSRAAHFMEVVARLAPGVSFEQADTAMSGLAQRLANDNPSTNTAWGVRPVPLLDDQLGYYRPALIVLFGAVGLLMLIATLNVASLLLTRALSRQREMAVRTALGASPRHLIAQLLVEAFALSIAGAAVGLLAALIALPAIAAATPLEIPRLAQASLNSRALGFALALVVGTTLLFGLIPAFAVVRRSLSADLRAGERGSSRATRVLYRALVSGEVALAAALLISCGLLVRTVAKMTDVPTGVTNDGVVISSLQLSGQAYADFVAVAGTYSRLLDRLREQPGVRAAGAANFLPLEAGWRIPFTVEGRPPVRADEAPRAQIISVTDGYFEAMGATLTSGRYFTARDDRPGVAIQGNRMATPRALMNVPGAAIVNEAFVDRFLAGQEPLSSVLLTSVGNIGPLGLNLVDPGRFQVVGVVGDVRNVPLGQPVEPAVYVPARQFPFRAMLITIDAVDQPAAVAALQSAMREIAPTLPMTGATTWAQRVRARSAEPRLLMTLLMFFGGLAGLLAALGVYGLFAWMVALRRRELAIRLTLGARPSSIGLSVVRQGAWLAVAGLVAGVALVQGARGALSRVLFEVSPADAGSTAAAALLLLAATLLACVPAAMRAMRVNPIEGLRTE